MAEFIHRSYHEEDGGWVPALLRCDCGAEVVLSDGLDNFCDGCDACYNMSGERVTPSSECNEYGEPYSDYYDSPYDY